MICALAPNNFHDLTPNDFMFWYLMICALAPNNFHDLIPNDFMY
jgi:hypothetical protein